MAFPVREDVNAGGDKVLIQIEPRGSASYDIDMPSTVNSGELLLMIYSIDWVGAPDISPSGWTQGFSTATGGKSFQGYYKSADGTEGGTSVTVDRGTPNRPTITHIWRISAWNDIAFGTTVDASSDSPNPPSLTPAFSGDILWVACSNVSSTASGATSGTAGPANYSNFISSVTTEGGSDDTTLLSAHRELNGSSEDPGAFTIESSVSWIANTIAIEPAADGATYTLTAEQGSYSLTGQSTGLLRTLRLISQQGSYAYTGQTTNLLKTYLLSAEQGSYSIVGADGELLETFILEAESGNYTLTGQETQFLRTLKLIANQGSYSLSGQTTNLLRNLLLTAEQGSYSLSGQDAIISVVSNYILNAESGSYSLTGNDTAFLRKLILEAGSGNYTLSGQQTQLLRKLLLSAASGNYTLTGEDIALTVEDSPEILILMSAIVSSLELDSTITTDLDIDSEI